MIELSLITESVSYSNEELTKDWTFPTCEKISKAAFWSSAFIGAVSFFSGMPKRRSVSIRPAGLGGANDPPLPPPPQVIEAPPLTTPARAPIQRLQTPLLPTLQTPTPPPPQRPINITQAPRLQPLSQEQLAFIAYDSLRWKTDDKKQIGEIVTTMGKEGKTGTVKRTFDFRKYEREMESGNEPLHPFKFLETIFGNPDLEQYMEKIFQDFFLRNGFMMGVKKGMNREAARNNLERFIAPFAAKVKTSPEKIRPLIRARDWERIVRLLIGTNAAHEERKYKE